MRSIRSIAILALYSTQLALIYSSSGVSATPPTCLNPVLSCQNTTAQNTCCFNYPGGQVLQTQVCTVVSGTKGLDNIILFG